MTVVGWSRRRPARPPARRAAGPARRHRARLGGPGRGPRRRARPAPREPAPARACPHAVDVVVGAGDLPAAGEAADRTVNPVTGPTAPEDHLEGLRLSHDILEHGVAALKRSRIEFEEARLQAVEAIEEARADLDPFATTAFEQAAAQLRRAEAQGDEPAPEPVVTESFEELEADRDRLQAELAEMDAIDAAPVAEALHQAERATPSADGLDAVAVASLADALRAAEAAVEALDEQRREAGRDPAELARRIEGARIQLERLQTSAAPPTISNEDRAELEAAHDAVIDADAKVSATRIGRQGGPPGAGEAPRGRAGDPRADGLPHLQLVRPGPVRPRPRPRDPGRAGDHPQRAGRARGRLPGRPHRRHRRPRARPPSRPSGTPCAATPAPSSTPSPSTSWPPSPAWPPSSAPRTSTPRPSVLLRQRLAERGVDFADLGLSDDEVIDLARVWLADMQALEGQREDLERELDTIQARLLVVAPVLGQGDVAAVDPLTRAQNEVEAAEARLARHRQASDRVAELLRPARGDREPASRTSATTSAPRSTWSPPPPRAWSPPRSACRPPRTPKRPPPSSRTCSSACPRAWTTPSGTSSPAWPACGPCPTPARCPWSSTARWPTSTARRPTGCSTRSRP